MPTTKPRIYVTVPPATFEVLRRISQASGEPMSTFISEMLEQATPYLDGMARALEQAKEQKVEAFQTLAHALAETQVPTAQLSFAIQQEIKAAAERSAHAESKAPDQPSGRKVAKSRSGKVERGASRKR